MQACRPAPTTTPGIRFCRCEGGLLAFERLVVIRRSANAQDRSNLSAQFRPSAFRISPGRGRTLLGGGAGKSLRIPRTESRSPRRSGSSCPFVPSVVAPIQARFWHVKKSPACTKPAGSFLQTASLFLTLSHEPVRRAGGGTPERPHGRQKTVERPERGAPAGYSSPRQLAKAAARPTAANPDGFRTFGLHGAQTAHLALALMHSSP